MDAVAENLISTQWKLANHRGAYAASTACGMNTSRSHGLLVSPIARGAQRLVLLSRVEESLRMDNQSFDLACNQYPGTHHPRGDQHLRQFDPSPRWLYASDSWQIEKRIHLLDYANIVILTYRLLQSTQPVEFSLRPLFALRPQRELCYQSNIRLSPERRTGHDFRIPATHRSPEVFFSADASFDPKGFWYYSTLYHQDDGLEDLWSPGQFHWTLTPDHPIHFVCSPEPTTVSSALLSLEKPARKLVTAHVSKLIRSAADSADAMKLNPNPRQKSRIPIND